MNQENKSKEILDNTSTNQIVQSSDAPNEQKHDSKNEITINIATSQNTQQTKKQIQIKKQTNDPQASQVTQTKDLINKEITQQINDNSESIQKQEVDNVTKNPKNDQDRSESDSKKYENSFGQKNIKKNPTRSTSSQRRKQQQANIHYEYEKDPTFFKTKLCPMFKNGTCSRGSKCNFAHGQNELRQLPNYRKTRLCIAYSQGRCNLDSKDCKYAHGQEDMKKNYNNYYSNTGNNSQRQKDYRNQKDQRSNNYNRNRDGYKDHRDRDNRQHRDYRNQRERTRDHRDSDRSHQRSKNRDKDNSSKYNQQVMRKYAFNTMSDSYSNPYGRVIVNLGMNPYAYMPGYPPSGAIPPIQPYVSTSAQDYRYPQSSSSWPYSSGPNGPMIPSVNPTSIIPSQYTRYDNNLPPSYNPSLPYYPGSYSSQPVSNFQKSFFS